MQCGRAELFHVHSFDARRSWTTLPLRASPTLGAAAVSQADTCAAVVGPSALQAEGCMGRRKGMHGRLVCP